MKVKTLLEHLQNMLTQGHGEVDVVLQSDNSLSGVRPLSKGDLVLLSNGTRALVLVGRKS